MQSRNPVFNRSEAFSRRGYAGFNEAPPIGGQQLEDMYNAPAATGVQTGRMTIDDVVVKTGLMFAVLVLLAGLNFFLKSPVLTIGGLIAGLVLGLIVSFKQSTNPGLILGYAAAEGLFVGGISAIFEAQWGGIVAQAVLGTLSVFGVALFAYKSGRVRVTPKFQRTVLIAMGGYLVFCLVNLGIVAFTDNNLRAGWLGVAIGLFAITLAAAFLIMDFDFAEQGVRDGLPERYSWLAAFGLVVTLVWLYIEFLRLISILRGD
ncbi:MAG: Bax inhibitor-1/YccA family protein [Sporichthyaceae bacterium]